MNPAMDERAEGPAARAGGPRTLVLATRNPGKVRELRALLAGLPLLVETLDDHPEVGELPETGETFEENAISKAAAVAHATGLTALADDSGLEIDALGGSPGVHSATFLGPQASDVDRYRWVLERMQGVEEEMRTARYRAVVAVASPDGRVSTFEGTCCGRITPEPQGGGGFGYDPVFLVPEHGRTMAELSVEEKNRISHRAKALRSALAHLSTAAGGSGI